MANLVCHKSSVIFNCEHIPQYLTDKTYTHPFFHIPQKTLISLYGKWSIGKFTPVESYLYYLALFNSTDLIDWRVPAQFRADTPGLVHAHLPMLVDAIIKSNSIEHPNFYQAHFVISQDTCDLTTTPYWIQLWQTNYNEWLSDRKQEHLKEHIKAKRERTEFKLSRLIRSNISRESNVAKQLADWADIAGYFPEHTILHPVKKIKTKCNEYWKDIIISCVNEEAIWKYPDSDISHLLEHCIDNIPHGNIFSNRLLSILRSGLKKHTDYFGLGDYNAAYMQGATTSFKILSDNDDSMSANKVAIVLSASVDIPKRENYPTPFAYMKAKMVWELAQKYKQDKEDGGD